MKKTTIVLGLALTLTLFITHLIILNDYGLTWDFHHHFFAGLHLLRRPLTPDLIDHIPFTQPSPLITNELPFGPLMSISPVLSYEFFFEKLKVLAFDNAYDLAIVMSGVLGIGIVYFFLAEALNKKTAVTAFIFLALLPRYFGDLHNNMKDVPQAAAFALAIWMFWRLITYRRIKDLLFASVAFAIAFNTKVNTVAVPIIGFLWLAISWGANRKPPLGWKGNKFVMVYFLLAPLFALILWIPFWKDPFGVLLYIPKFFQINTLNIEVLLHGQWYCSGVNVPWYYPFWYLAITTPLLVLACFVWGLVVMVKDIISSLVIRHSTFDIRHSSFVIRHSSFYLLVLLWFFVPLARYLYPKMGVIDGIRHFEEVVYPLAIIAAIGAGELYRYACSRLSKKSLQLIACAGIISLLWNIIVYHPFQIAYFNELVGGIKGAYGKYDIDYWGSSQKQAIAWINKHAPIGSTIQVPMAADVASKYLREDLLPQVNTTDYLHADYVVVLNRQSFFYRYYLVDYLLTHNPIEVVENQGVPFVWIYDNRKPALPTPQAPWWSGSDLCV